MFFFGQIMVWALSLGLFGFAFYCKAATIHQLRKEKDLGYNSKIFEGKGLLWHAVIMIECAFIVSGIIGVIAAGFEGRIGVDLSWSILGSWLLLGLFVLALNQSIQRLKKYQALTT